MTQKMAYTFGDEQAYPRGSYVIIETETMDQQRAAAIALFGVSERGVRFSFDYLLDDHWDEQVKRYHYVKAAEFSLLPTKPAPANKELQSLYLEAVVDSVRVIDDEEASQASQAIIDMVRSELERHMPSPVGLRAIWEAAR